MASNYDLVGEGLGMAAQAYQARQPVSGALQATIDPYNQAKPQNPYDSNPEMRKSLFDAVKSGKIDPEHAQVAYQQGIDWQHPELMAHAQQARGQGVVSPQNVQSMFGGEAPPQSDGARPFSEGLAALPSRPEPQGGGLADPRLAKVTNGDYPQVMAALQSRASTDAKNWDRIALQREKNVGARDVAGITGGARVEAAGVTGGATQGAAVTKAAAMIEAGRGHDAARIRAAEIMAQVSAANSIRSSQGDGPLKALAGNLQREMASIDATLGKVGSTIGAEQANSKVAAEQQYARQRKQDIAAQLDNIRQLLMTAPAGGGTTSATSTTMQPAYPVDGPKPQAPGGAGTYQPPPPTVAPKAAAKPAPKKGGKPMSPAASAALEALRKAQSGG